ncbi:MAG: AI-2E family transporter [Myxococcota bacterium]
MTRLDPDPPTLPGIWSPVTRDRWFLGVFALSLVAVFVVFGPFLDALILASATVVVSWPLYEWVRGWTGDRPYLASAVTTSAVVLLVLVPVSLLGVWFVQEASALVLQAVELVRVGAFRETVESWVWTAELPSGDRLTELLGDHVDVVSLIVEPVQRTAVSIGQTVAASLPNLVGSVFGVGLDLFVFLFAVVTLYAEGPRLLRAAGRLSPLRPEYHRRLFEVFREFSTNLVLGALTTASVQAATATLAYAVAGAPNLVLLGLMTAVFSFIPIVGTATVWVPVALYVGFEEGWAWGAFVALWNGTLTASVDNVLRPLLLRGRSPIHPLPIFLSVLGGIYWIGLPGALMGPVTVAMFVALYRIWTDELAEQGIVFLDATPAPAPPASLPPLPRPEPGAVLGGLGMRPTATPSAAPMASTPTAPAAEPALRPSEEPGPSEPRTG